MRKKLNPAKTGVDFQQVISPHSHTGRNVVIINSVELNILLAKKLMSDRYTRKRHQLPDSYVQFVEKHNGWEGDLGDYYGYVVIWTKESIEDRWLGYEMAKYLPDHWFPFGSNGGSDMLCFDLRKKGDTSYLIPYVGMSEEEAMEHCVSFELIAAEIARRITPDGKKG